VSVVKPTQHGWRARMPLGPKESGTANCHEEEVVSQQYRLRATFPTEAIEAE